MAITTDSYYDIKVGDVTVDQIGLSKTLDQYTIAELQNYIYCGANLSLIRNLTSGVQKNLINAIASGEPSPVSAEQTGVGHYAVTSGEDLTYDYPDGIQSATVWIAYAFGETPPDYITNTLPSNGKLITEMPANKLEYILPSPRVSYTGFATSWAENSGVAYDCRFDSAVLQYRVSSNVTEQVSPWGGPVLPYTIITTDNSITLMRLDLSIGSRCSWYSRGQGWDDSNATGGGGLVNYNTPQSWDEHHGFCFTISTAHTDFTQLDSATVMPIDWNWRAGSPDWGMSGWYAAKTYETDIIGQIVFNGQPSDGVGYQRSISTNYWLNNFDSANRFIANIGVKFYTNKLYKPIIQSGWVVGYTDNMDTPSDLDNWSGSTKHTVNPPGPTPPGPGPYDDDPWSGVSFSGVGVGGAGAFAKCYYMTSTELANLRSWMNSNNVPEGFDPMAQIIGLSQVPVILSGDDNSTVQFVNSSAVYDPGVTRLVDSGVTTQIAMGTPIRYSLGSVDIVRRMQERGEPYLDYDCQIELYLPLIGMFSLDTQAVMGRTISAYAVLDPVSGTLAAYAYVSRDGQNLPIAYGSTTIGVDLPISAQQLSVSRAALKQANAQLGASLLSGALTMLAAASSGGKSSGSGAKTATGSSGLSAAGIREAGSDYMKASQVGNVFGDFMQWGRTIRQLSYGNNTAIAGSFGGSTAQWSYPFTPYVKIIRPRFEKPSNYNHSQGVPCVQTKTIGSCTGFIQCIGADVSGITGATDLELQAIQAALSNGIYAGGGQ